MSLPEPRASRWNLRWRMFGADFRVHPLFWVSSALSGVRYYQDPTDGGVGVFVFWMIAVFLSIMLHELGHVFTARLFGVCGRVYLSGLGGRLLNLGELKRWQRLIVLLAGPLTSLSIIGVGFGVVWAINCKPVQDALNARGWYELFVNGTTLVMVGNLWWGLLNLLPLLPLDGGQMATELAEGLLGQRGPSLAALLSVLVAGLLTVWVVVEMRLRLIDRFNPLYRLYFEVFVILSLYCFAFWLSAFIALWGDPAAKNQSV